MGLSTGWSGYLTSVFCLGFVIFSGQIGQKGQMATTGSSNTSTSGTTGSTGNNPPPNKIVFDSLVKSLAPCPLSGNPSVLPLYSSTGNLANFSLTCQYTPPAGYIVATYSWSNPWTTTDTPAQSFVIGGSTNNATATGSVGYPGVFVATCMVTLEQVSTGAFSSPISVEGSCAVIGGPIYFNYQAQISNQPTVPNNDGGDPANSVHLQNFGFDPTTAQPPANTQSPIFEVTAIAGPQPAGTSFTWSYGGLKPQGSSSSVACLLAATVAGGPYTVKCTETLTYVDMYNVSQSLTTNDDTAGTQFYDSYTKTTATRPNTVKVHQPSSLKLLTKVSNPAPVPDGGTSCGDDYTYQLLDSTGSPEPGVWVQEQFMFPGSQGDPPNMTTNGTDGFVWTSDISGDLTADHITASWTAPTPNNQFTSYSAGHNYYAAMHVYGVVAGIKVAPYQTLWNPGTVNSNNGTTSNQ